MSKSRPNYLSAILSVALVLLLLGLFALSALYGNRVVELFKEKVDIWLELKPDIAEGEANRIIRIVRSQPFVKKETVTLVTREQVAASMREDLGDDSFIDDLPALARDIVRFNVKADYLSADSLAGWRAEMKQDSAIADLFFEASSTGNAGQNLEKMGYLTLALALLLIFAAVTLIHNTIRLALYANRFVVKNQELVGASWSFITRPYIRRGIINGLLSAFLAILALLALLWAAQGAIPELEALQDQNGVLSICVGMLLLGVLISGLSSWWVVNKFLRMRLEDLY